MAIELTEDLIELERAAWAEQQAGGLTFETSLAVQTAYTAHAKASKQPRLEVEMETKRRVRHPEA